ncbi:MAG: ATP phosphoribosyltransferase regulatory subunit, partial [Peptococcaceae bacterium]|nr:ATP phosphoribosyltransferase regulatory subunit [Peptococcaceae bacterium]
VKEYVALDLGILRGFSYYTGAIFEGYLPGVGIPVVEGGRYDGLYADFGVNYPATGFAMNMGAIMERQTEFRVENPEVLVYGDSQREVIKYCQKLRREGKTVEMVLEPLTDQQAQDLALRKAIGQVIKV